MDDTSSGPDFSHGTVRRWLSLLDPSLRQANLMPFDVNDPQTPEASHRRRCWKDLWATFHSGQSMPQTWAKPPIQTTRLIRVAPQVKALTQVLNTLLRAGVPRHIIQRSCRRAIAQTHLERLEVEKLRNQLRLAGISSTGKKEELLEKYSVAVSKPWARRAPVSVTISRPLDKKLDTLLVQLSDKERLQQRKLYISTVPELENQHKFGKSIRLALIATNDLVIDLTTYRVMGRWHAKRAKIEELSRADVEWCVKRGLEFRIPSNLNVDEPGVDASILATELGPEYFKDDDSGDDTDEEIALPD
jgi:hypothetical protein